MVDKIGQIEAVVDAIGESDNEIGGLNQTRLTATVVEAEALGPPFVWDGTTTVLTPDTSGVSPGEFIRLDEDGQPFEILAVVPNVSVALDDNDLVVPTGPVVTVVGATLTWDGTLTVTTPDTSELGPGVWIRLDADSQWFQITSLVTDTSVTLLNPFALSIPSGATQSSKNTNPVTSKVTNSVGVETTLNWPDSGKISIGGITYNYASKTLGPPSFDVLTYTLSDEDRPGLQKAHNQQSTVTDLSKSISAIDQVRRAMLVDHAEGEDLNIVGRNLGVLRFPFLESDDVFREIIKALAYNPKGTIFGMELALTAMVGAGNFLITEDLINFPNTVFIELLGGPFTSNESEGKAYLTPNEYQPATADNELEIEVEILAPRHAHSIVWKDENHLSTFRDAKPSVDSIVDYEGDAGTIIWVYTGDDEADVVQLADAVEFIDSGANPLFYTHKARVVPESYVAISMLTEARSAGTWSDVLYNQWGLQIDDGDFEISWGGISPPGLTWNVSLTSGGALATGAAVIGLALNIQYDIELRKYGTDRVEFWIDGQLRDSLPYAAFTNAGSVPSFKFGVIDAGAAVRATATRVRYYARTTTDYFGARGEAGDVNVANGRRLDVNIAAFFDSPYDLGRRMMIRNSGATNAQGGNNNGTFDIEAVIAADTVDLEGRDQTGGTVQGSLLTRFTAGPDGQKFVFPDDLGKTLVISNSTQGNDGSYTITDLLDPNSLESFTKLPGGILDASTLIRQETTVCEVSAATFVSEGSMEWQLDPDFVTEANVEWEMSDAGFLSADVINFRQDLPISGVGYTRVLNVIYSRVLSSQILLDLNTRNELTQLLPTLLFSYYPFYISDPLAFIRSFLDDVTAAGVIPEFLES